MIPAFKDLISLSKLKKKKSRKSYQVRTSTGLFIFTNRHTYATNLRRGGHDCFQ